MTDDVQIGILDKEGFMRCLVSEKDEDFGCGKTGSL